MALRTILPVAVFLLTAWSALAQDAAPPGEPVSPVLFDKSIGLTVLPVRGVPDNRGARLAELVAEKAAESGVHIARSPADGAEAFELVGVAAAAAGTEVTTLLVLWSLHRADGAPVDSFNTEVTLNRVAGDPWDKVDDDLLAGLAEITAARLVKMEARFAMVQNPRAKPKEIAALGAALSSSNASNGAVLDTIAARADLPTPLRMGAITGAPGDGSALLTARVMSLLNERNIPIASSDDTKWYEITANVTLTPAGANHETVVIIWRVTDTLGQELGQVRQQNELPPGALEPTWGEDADFAAMGAVDGILSLLGQAGEVY